MRRSSIAVIVLMFLAGCVDGEAPTAEPIAEAAEDPSAPVTAEVAANASIAPLLVDIDGDLLRNQAIELIVPAGTFRIVRIVYTADIWDESEPWDGSASLFLGAAWRTEGTGVVMSAFGFGSAFQPDATLRPFIDFSVAEGDSWMASWTSSSCSGGCSIPQHQRAILVGAHDAPLTLRMGILSDFDASALWSREVTTVRADAETRDAVAGEVLRIYGLEPIVRGNISAVWDEVLDVGGVAYASRTTKIESEVTVPAGMLSASMYGLDHAGADLWSYQLQAPGMDASFSSPWLFAPYSTMLATGGVLWPPWMGLQSQVAEGRITWDFQRDYTGLVDSGPTLLPSFEWARFGHAAIDLEAMYGWDVTRQIPPDRPVPGAAECIHAPALPAPVCRGDVRAMDEVPRAPALPVSLQPS